MDSLPRRGAAPADTARLLQIMWGAFVGAAMIYGFVPYLAPAGDDALTPAAHGAMYSAAAGAAVASFVTRRWWINSIAARQTAGAVPADTGALQARVKAGAIVTWALSEAVAIIGVVRAFLGHDPSYGLPFVAASVLLLYLHRPSTWPLGDASGAA